MIDSALVKQHLRVLHNREDAVIEAYTNAALRMFEQFTERTLFADQTALDDADPAPEFVAVMDADIQAGALILIGYLYSTRDMDASMPRATERLWQPYRVLRIS